jgi:hypothetical protein
LEATFTHGDYARYPFLPKYEELLRTAPSFASPEFQKILTYARERIAQAARGAISQPLPEDDWAWALSFYVAGLAIRFAGNPLLLNRFARLEAERSRSHFERELGIQQLLPSMLTIVNHLFKQAELRPHEIPGSPSQQPHGATANEALQPAGRPGPRIHE